MRSITRRHIVRAAGGVTFAGMLPDVGAAQSSVTSNREAGVGAGALAAALQGKMQGQITAAGDAAYKQLRRDLVWNEVVPRRYPKLICRAASENDVSEAVDFARLKGLRVAVRGGGHNWSGFSLRDDSLLIDLSGLDKIVAMDAPSRTAVVQPGVRGAVLSAALATRGLAFPIGHCPTVRLSGFLLNGGLGWNLGSWGPSCFSVQAANVVTADGTIRTASEAGDRDLLWAVRGAGPGFFGAITRYHLHVYPAPRGIAASTYFYRLAHLDQVGAWAASIAPKMPRQVELTLFVMPAPPSLAGEAKPANGYVACLSGVAFADTPDQAKAALEPLARAPASLDILSKAVHQNRTMPELLSVSGELWPERHRYLADNLWTEAPVEQPLAAMRDHFLRAPSPNAVALCVFTTGTEPPARSDAAAFSMMARNYIVYYAVWEQAGDDRANETWYRELTSALDPFAVGHYIGEADIVANPARAARSFTTENWERLQKLRRVYDPAGLFLGPFGST